MLMRYFLMQRKDRCMTRRAQLKKTRMQDLRTKTSSMLLEEVEEVVRWEEWGEWEEWEALSRCSKISLDSKDKDNKEKEWLKRL